MPKPFSISAYSTALFSTWVFVPEAAVLFDCGDGVTAQLRQKAGRIKHVFLSHADRDHLGGLLQFHQLNARSGLTFYYPRDSGSFPALRDFCERFDARLPKCRWVPVEHGAEISIRSDLVVRAQRNEHVNSEQTKSLSYFVDGVRRKLRSEYQDKSGSELASLRQSIGGEAMTQEHRETLFCYSGDTPIEIDGRYDDVQTLVHEATFLTRQEIDPENPRRNKHSSLDDVMAMVSASNIQRLVLTHFSTRYDRDEIETAVKKHVMELGLSLPIHLVLPGEVVHIF